MQTDPATLECVRWLASHALVLFGFGLLCVLATAGAIWRVGERYGVQRESSRWPPVAYLLAYLVLGFAFIAGAAELFAEIAESLGNDSPVGRLDEAFSATLGTTLPVAALKAFALITHLGDPLWLGAICLLVAALLARHRQWWLVSGWLLAILGNGLLNRLLKSIFERSRPLHDHGLAHAEGWSFPSGHTSGSAVVYGMLAYLGVRLLPRHWPAWLRLAAVLLATGLAFTVGSSRVFLQVHFATDVLAGFASGTAWLAVCIGALELARYGLARRPSSLRSDTSVP
ncbi:MAG: phosphatase PAP2 family protein [Comamonadaceae bacterium]|nr:MAG: phosphatase PAP2 family protein [Comamonadaceae bacterium]